LVDPIAKGLERDDVTWFENTDTPGLALMERASDCERRLCVESREVDDDTPGLGGNAGYNRALDEDHFAFECPVALSFVPVELDDAIGIARTLVSDVSKIGFAALSQDND
jgi:hypothetical protein